MTQFWVKCIVLHLTSNKCMLSFVFLSKPEFRNSYVKSKVKTQRLKKIFWLILRSKCLNLRCSTVSWSTTMFHCYLCGVHLEVPLSVYPFSVKDTIERHKFQAVWFVLSTLMSGKEENTSNYTIWHEIPMQRAVDRTVVGNERDWRSKMEESKCRMTTFLYCWGWEHELKTLLFGEVLWKL